MTTFLIIDDDKIDRMIIERAFATRYPDITCLHASSMATALDVVARTEIDYFIIDMSLSDGTGFDCMNAIKDQLKSSSIPVSFMSGAVRLSDNEQAWAVNSSEIFLKPMRRSENGKFADKVYTAYESFSSTKRVSSAN